MTGTVADVHICRMSRPLQHDVPAPPLDAASTGTLDQRPVTFGHQSNRCWIEVGLDVMPIGSVALSDGRGPGERTRTALRCAEHGSWSAVPSRARMDDLWEPPAGRYRLTDALLCRQVRTNRSGLLAADWYGQLVADLADLSPDRYAPLIAPVLERLTFAVVRMSVSRPASMPPPGGASAGAMRMFAQLRTALAARTVTAAGIAAVYRYRDPGEVRGDLDGLRAAGLIDAAGDGAIRATETGRAVLGGMYQVGAEVTGQLWSQHGDALAGLNDLAGRVVQAGLATGGDAYMTLAPPYEPVDATVDVLLHHRLSVLRYHRADAHAAAWQAAGLTSEAMMQLPAGPMRAAIEAETNRRAGVPYATLSVDERVALLAGLAALPG